MNKHEWKEYNRAKRLSKQEYEQEYSQEYSQEYNYEGSGRAHHAGGLACDYCPHCYGNANWCPLLD